ncbi:ciliated left-right organizer metallopeptidase [Genypterus blacodes]|uniref:ciliated left-right organizer metallopeptidase n=1 Tax=Genypterus blacodes TaxID=154954 RepID=UPI003F776FC7
MALPPPPRFWAAMMMMVLVVELSVALQKCVFDEVQARVRVVTAAPVHPESPPSETRPGTLSQLQTRHPGQRASPQRALFLKKMKRSEQTAANPASPQPIRIRVWVPRESLGLSEAEKARLRPAVEEAVGAVSSLLSVNRVHGPLLLSRDINKYCKFLWKNSSVVNYNRCGRANNNYRTETCLDVTIPDDHLGGCVAYPEANSPRRTVLRPEGAGLPDADFLLYLHVWSTDKCRAEPNVLAYAVHCQTDAHGRPLAGVVVICRERLTAATYSHQATVQTVIHELFHALGFSKALFSTWSDCSSSSPQGTGCSPLGAVTHVDGSGQMRIFTQSVVSALQRHLASSDPELGGPLENLGVSPGSVSSHWESRVLQGSIMGAVLGDWTTVRVDPVTLAALRDTGWYTVNLSRAQSLVWGDGEGESFGSLSHCRDNSSSFFCSGSGLGCHYLHLHKGECKTDQYLEGCHVYKPLKNGSECWKEANHKGSSEADQSGEIFGFESRCFFSNLTKEFLSTGSSVVGCCYRHRCTGLNRYQILVSGSDWIDCPAGGIIQIQGYQGLVFCPDRRLCLYPDVAPPSDNLNTFPASTTNPISSTSYSHQTFTPAAGLTWSSLPLADVPRAPAQVGVVPALGVTAVGCIAAAVVISYRKYRLSRIRVHTAPEV